MGTMQARCRMRVSVVLGFSLVSALPAAARAQDEPPDLYDPTVLRTLDLTFASPTFFADIDRISSTTVDGQVTADLTVDGIVYPGVGVRFRGNTSQRNVGQKRSLKISIDHTDPDQRLYGYRTLKLNNAASDPTFLREVLYSRVCHEYYPSPTANHVRLELNGQDWGVYASVQFFNKDFLGQWFERTGGNRWKAPSGGGTGPGGGGPRCNLPGGFFACGDRALMWLGATLTEYSSRYELNADEEPDPWGDLMRFCDGFNNTPDADFESLAPELIDVDAALWLLALENVFADHDGYLEKGADYAIYQQPDGGRLHLVQHDANECFQSTSWGLFPSLTNDQRPVVKRLLAVPRFKARYVAHVRTVLDEWFDWDVLGPFAAQLRDLIAQAVEEDPKKVYTTALFEQNFETSVTIAGGFGGGTLPGLHEFVDSRRAALLRAPELQAAPPSIDAPSLGLEAGTLAAPGVPVAVSVRVQSTGPLTAVVLHCSESADAPFTAVELLDDGAHGDGAAMDGVHGGEIPGYLAGAFVRYYVEAVGATATSFFPERAERGALTYRVGVIDAASTPVVLNELMASNRATIADPQGEQEDWLELHNLTAAPVDISGMYLTDNPDNPRKWRVPDGTTIASLGYLLVWLDEDGRAEGGLHASFKLSSGGETIWLLDADERLNQRLDAVTFGPLEADQAWARLPDGSGAFGEAAATPGWENGAPPPAAPFLRADGNADGALNLSDPVFVLRYLFQGGEAPGCEKAADADDSGALELTDSIYALNFLFLGGAAPPAPFERCGQDPTPDALGCGQHGGCR